MSNAVIPAVQLGLDLTSMLDTPQLTWLFALAQLAPDGNACEVGVYKGGSIACWGQARIGRGLIWAVDAFGPEKKWADAHGFFCEALVKAGIAEITTVIRENSITGSAYVPSDLAFLFIDAQHDLGGIDLDIKVWPQKVKPGGIIVYHDYLSSSPNAIVGQSVDAWQEMAHWIPLGMIGSACAFQRPYTPAPMELPPSG